MKKSEKIEEPKEVKAPEVQHNIEPPYPEGTIVEMGEKVRKITFPDGYVIILDPSF